MQERERQTCDVRKGGRERKSEFVKDSLTKESNKKVACQEMYGLVNHDPTLDAAERKNEKTPNFAASHFLPHFVNKKS